MDNPEEIYLAFVLDAISWNGVIDWATKKYNPDDNSALNQQYLNLASLSKNDDEDRKEVGNILNHIIGQYCPNFESAREVLAMKLLRSRCQDLLEKRIRPYGLCKLVTPIENTFDYPDWLGDLYNVCDWCEPDTEPDSYLLTEANERIRDIDKRLTYLSK